jgi:hypothetical protein
VRLFYFLLLVFGFVVLDCRPSDAQVVLYPNGKRVKILSSRSGANQLAGNQRRYIINEDREVYVDPKKRELDEKQARARMAYPQEDYEEESSDSSAEEK